LYGIQSLISSAYLQLEVSGIARGQAQNPKDEHDTFAQLSQSELHSDFSNNLFQMFLHGRREHRRRRIGWVILADDFADDITVGSFIF